MEFLFPKRLAVVITLSLAVLVASLLLSIHHASDRLNVVESIHIPLLERNTASLRFSEQLQTKLNYALVTNQKHNLDEMVYLQKSLLENLNAFQQIAQQSNHKDGLYKNLNRSQLNKTETEIFQHYKNGNLKKSLQLFQSDSYQKQIEKHTDALQASSAHLAKVRLSYSQSQDYYFRLILITSGLLISLIISLSWKLLFDIRKKFDHQKISEILLEEERLKSIHSSKLAALGEMAGGIAHEINNPLAIIKGYAEILAKESRQNKLNSETLEKLTDHILQTTLRISKIVVGLKKLTRNAQAEVKQAASLKQILDETLSLCSERFQTNGIKIKVKYAVQDTVLCNPIEISQVFINLLNNSYDAIISHKTPWVKIECNRSHDLKHLLIEITDSGNGISAEIRSNIMNPFFTTKNIGQGTGLGLSISKGIIAQHEGELLLDSNSPYTKFLISLPLSDPLTSNSAEQQSKKYLQKIS